MSIWKKKTFAFTAFHTHVNPTQTVDLKAKNKTVRLLEENIEEYLYDLEVEKSLIP